VRVLERKEMSKSGLNWNLEDMNERQLVAVGVAMRTKKRDKYNRSPKEERTTEGIIFDSKKEMNYYLQLKQNPDISFFLRQVPFHLPGKVKYRADFMVVYPDNRIEFIDVKGMRTDMYKLKKKQVESLYPVKIKEV
jgi:hypothetical protein